MCPPGRLRSISIAARIIPTLVNGHTGLRHSAQCSCCNSRFRHRLQAYGPSPNSAVATVDSVNARRLTAAATVHSVNALRLTAAATVHSVIARRLFSTELQKSIPESSPGSPQCCCSRFRHRPEAVHRAAAVISVIF